VSTVRGDDQNNPNSLLDSDSSLKPGREQRTWFEQQIKCGFPMAIRLCRAALSARSGPYFQGPKTTRNLCAICPSTRIRSKLGSSTSNDRSVAAAQAVFRKALSRCLPRWPRKITLDGLKQSHLALRLLRREDPKWKYVQVRSSQYLNILIEQDHRAVKRRCASMGGFKSFRTAAITLAGIELAHRIRKGQFSFGRGRYRNLGSLKQIWDRALA
jgi:hypothetical protein